MQKLFWIVGCLSILFGIVLLDYGFFYFLFFFVSGLSLIPPITTIIERKINWNIDKYLKFFFIVILTVSFLGILENKSKEEENSKKTAEENNFFNIAENSFNNKNYEIALSQYKTIPPSSNKYSLAIERIKTSYEEIYKNAIATLNNNDYIKAKALFVILGVRYKDTEKYLNIINEQEKPLKYKTGLELYNAGKYSEAISYFQSIGNYEDSLQLIAQAQEIINLPDYNKAVELYKSKKYDESIELLQKLGDFKDCQKLLVRAQENIKLSDYNKAIALYKSKKYDESIELFQKLGNFKSSEEFITKAERGLLDSRVEEISYKQLSKNPDRYKGSFIKFHGKVFTIQEDSSNTVMQINVTHHGYGFWSDQIMVMFNGITDLVVDSKVTFYGTVVGSHTYTSVAGWTITVPLVSAEKLYY